ncbi:MAG: hypothetical protein WAM14_15760 [Candidatus Nitrosopolaris sp.]
MTSEIEIVSRSEVKTKENAQIKCNLSNLSLGIEELTGWKPISFPQFARDYASLDTNRIDNYDDCHHHHHPSS